MTDQNSNVVMFTTTTTNTNNSSTVTKTYQWDQPNASWVLITVTE
jgi:hypothetical protein